MVMDEGPLPASDKRAYDAIAGLAPMHRLGQPIEIAQAVAWLCSDAASFVTGHPLVVDGGVAAGRERAEDAIPDALAASPYGCRTIRPRACPARIRSCASWAASSGIVSIV